MKYRIKRRYNYYIQRKRWFKWEDIHMIDFSSGGGIRKLEFETLEEAVCTLLFISKKNKANIEEINIIE